MELKWIGHDDKITKLKKILILKKSELNAILTTVSGIETKKKELEKDKSAEIRFREIEKELVDTDESIHRVTVEMTEYADAAKGKAAYANFKAKGYGAALNKWIKDNADEKYTNRYEVTLEDGSTMYTTESLGAQMIGQEIVFQLAKIDDTDFNSKIAATGTPFDTTQQTKLTGLLAKIRTYAAELDHTWTKVENGKAVGPEGSGGIGRRYEKNGVEIITHEYNTKLPTLKYKDLFDFVHLLAPITEMNGIDAPFFTKLSNKWGTNQKWYIWKAQDQPLTEEERKKLIKEGNAPQEFLNCKFAYFDDHNKGKVINLKDGLEGWIKLYYMIFLNKSNREKVIRSVNGDGGTLGTSIENILITNYHDATFQTNCSYESELEDEEGNKIRVFAVSDPNEVASRLGLRKRALETKKKLLEENELKDQGVIYNEWKKKVDDEKRKLEEEEGKIDALIKDEIAAKQKKVTDMNLTGLSDSDWSNANTILKATAAKRLLLDINWLENEGKDGRPFKQSTNQTILDLIDSKRKDVAAWNAVIKQKFESLGTDLASRITAAKADTEIGLELFRDAYEELGDQTVVDAINAELAKDKPQQSGITTENLKALFNFEFTADEANSWKKSDEKTIANESDIKTIFFDAYSPTAADKTKYNALLKYLKENGDDGGKKEYDDSDDTKKAESWQKFIKKGAKTVIRTIVTHEHKADLDKPANKDNPLVKNMKSNATADNNGYNTDPTKNKFNKERYGNPETGEGITKDKIITYLHDKRVKDIKLRSEAWSKTETPSTPSPTEEKTGWKAWFVPGKGNIVKPLITYTGIVLGLAAIGVAIFWKQVKDWWNGPAEEEGAGVEKKEDEDEIEIRD
ncbi:protein of unknown function [endosymbiont DhMRE of Dentiscutata heterogama]|uniref:hypothetical protein n=1 Tax=endosymbiont DhMRE of Dentiscutata heterogama TaxID=1609546 RepID=UPI000629DCE7|nr:hypothetical protein [endosymbiont DhMRE of Dentiscutata heterogama]CFW93435.1 protein of unknown function [endosymbiont DhMRE of Dentiscutata heterogama]